MKKINNSNRPLGESFLSLKKTCLLSKGDKTPIYVSYPFLLFFRSWFWKYHVETDTLLIVSSATYLFNQDMICAPRNVCYTCETLSFHFYTILNRHCVSLAVMGNNLRHTGNVHSTKSRRYCYQKKKKFHIKLG